MSATPSTGPCWSTASFGEATETSPRELSALGEHLALCRSLDGRLFTLRCAFEATRDFVASRFVTSLVLVMLAAGLGSLAL